MGIHTNHIIARWDTAPAGSWLTVQSSEELVTLEEWYTRFLSTNHGKCRGNVWVDGKNEHADCFGHGNGLFHDSWRDAERYKRYSWPGNPTNGPGVHSSAPPPEARLDLESDFCPRGRSHSSCCWPGTASDWMSSMSLMQFLSLKMHVFCLPLEKLF